MILGNLFKLVFFMIVIYFFYSIIRMLLFSARNFREHDEHRRRKSEERIRAGGRKGRAAKGDEVIELDKDQYKVE